MRDFATLVNTLDSTNKTLLKQEAIARYLIDADEVDKLWFLALFTGKKPKRNVNSSDMKRWAMELAGIPEWLFVESYATVGDLAETLSLLLPNTPTVIDLSLAEWMDLIQVVRTEEEKKDFVLHAWSQLDYMERFIFNKLIGGSFRLGVSSKIVINTVAKVYGLDPAAVTHSIMGKWEVKNTNFEALIRGEYTDTLLSKPYPFCLAYSLDKPLEELGDARDWQVEYKWDGIRGQFIKREGEVFIWSRGEELVTDQFPDLVELLRNIPGDFVLDGEILGYKEGQILNFSELQKRLNRKVISKKLREAVPVGIKLYDILERDDQDLRELTLSNRRVHLEELALPQGPVLLSESVSFSSWEELQPIRDRARHINAEGLMLKNRYSPYHTGRKRGDWWKWKIDPLSIDAVLTYAQKGSGRRSGYYTDYTFAVRSGDELVTIAKAYSGLTDKEIQEVSKFVSKNTLEKFGPVRTVVPELVFEIGFEGIGYSTRHKSGVALRFPRIMRWRKDKSPGEIDDIEDVKKLIK